MNNNYYWCDELDKPEFEGQQLPVRYDPFNYAIGYVYLKDRWVKCLADNYHELEGRTEREQMILSAEKRMRDRRFSERLADRAVERANAYLADQEIEKGQAEKLLLLRKKQLENILVLRTINAGFGGNVDVESEAGNSIEVQQRKDNLEQDISLFKDIDLDDLGSLEAYKG
jgi:hypothetical protein